MSKFNLILKYVRVLYSEILLRFSNQIRDPYLIKIDKIYTSSDTNDLNVSFHIANKRVSQSTTVREFIKTDMIYLIDPRMTFEIGVQFGVHSEKLSAIEAKPTLKNKCISGIKRVFIDE